MPASLTPQRVRAYYELALDAGLDILVIQGTVVSAEHVSQTTEPLNLKEFIREVDVPVVVGGCASYSTGLHLMRTGAAGVLVGVGPGAACTTRGVLGIGVPQATAIADVAAARSQHMLETGEYVKVIADGGMRTGGDVSKAIACGADAVMIGSPLARAYEAPGHGYHWGMATFHPSLPARRARADGAERHARGDPLRPRARERRHVQPHGRAAHLDGHLRLQGHRGVQPRGAHDRPRAADRGQGAADGAGRRHGRARLGRAAPAGNGSPRPRPPAGVSATSPRSSDRGPRHRRDRGDRARRRGPSGRRAATSVDEVVVLDYGGQYSQLIARRVRECGVFSELLPHHVGAEEVRRRKPKGLILSGGPASVYADGAPRLEPELLELGIPVLGICYGMQLLARELGGRVEGAEVGEFGRSELTVREPGRLLAGLPARADVLDVASRHGLRRAPPGFTALASSTSRRSRRSRTSSAASTASSSTPRSSTRPTGRRS